MPWRADCGKEVQNKWLNFNRVPAPRAVGGARESSRCATLFRFCRSSYPRYPIANAWPGPYERDFEEDSSFDVLTFKAVRPIPIIEINCG